MTSDRPNVLLLTLDALRADRVGCIGGGDLTPAIDGLAEDAHVFTCAYANGPKTKASFPAIFTSTLPFHDGTYAQINRRDSFVPPLREAGYRTGGYSRNPWLRPVNGYDQGFDTFDYTDEAGFVRDLKDRIKAIDHPVVDRLVRFYRARRTTDAAELEETRDAAVRFLDGFAGEEPYFAWLHSHATHTPYLPPDDILEDEGIEFENTREAFVELADDPEAADRELITRLYDACVRGADRVVEQALEAVDLDETVVIVTADHGQEQFERGAIGHSTLHQEVMHVPLIVHVPGDAASENDVPVQLADIPPTVLYLAGLDAPGSYQGTSLFEVEEERPLIAQTGNSPAGQVGDETDDFRVSVRVDGYRYIHAAEADDELYDLDADPREMENIIDAEPDVADRLLDVIREHDAIPRGTEVERDVEDEAVKQRLKELGYYD